MGAGIITKEYTIWCGYCEEWEQASCFTSKRDFEKACRRSGWRKKHNAFICVRCQHDNAIHGRKDKL